jgi:hypothetical protein
MKNEKWHSTFWRKILYSFESFTKRIAQIKSWRFSCEWFRIRENSWAFLKKILMTQHIEER